MALFLLRRIALSFLVVFGVLIVTFVVTRVAPSDPARMYAGPRATTAQIEAAAKKLGADQPVYVQLERYITAFWRGDWGQSLATKRSVAEEIAACAPYTIELAVLAQGLALLVGIPLGLSSANNKDRWQDHTSRVIAVGAVSIPTFWLALALQYVFFGKLHVLPMGGAQSYAVALMDPITKITGFPLIDAVLTRNWAAFWDHIVHLVLPVLALTACLIGSVQRLTRAAMVEILNEDYIVAARSYGLPERLVLWSYTLKNALGPVVTIAALCIAYSLVNTFLVEAIFSWPGVGNYVARAALNLDYPAITAVSVLSAISYVVLNTMADIIIALDPRVRIHA